MWQVKAATWALKNGVSVVICNGCEEKAIINIVKGKKVGTFFTMSPSEGTPVEVQAREGKTPFTCAFCHTCRGAGLGR